MEQKLLKFKISYLKKLKICKNWAKRQNKKKFMNAWIYRRMNI